jgi:hypothetical protein
MSVRGLQKPFDSSKQAEHVGYIIEHFLTSFWLNVSELRAKPLALHKNIPENDPFQLWCFLGSIFLDDYTSSSRARLIGDHSISICERATFDDRHSRWLGPFFQYR